MMINKKSKKHVQFVFKNNNSVLKLSKKKQKKSILKKNSKKLVQKGGDAKPVSFVVSFMEKAVSPVSIPFIMPNLGKNTYHVLVIRQVENCNYAVRCYDIKEDVIKNGNFIKMDKLDYLAKLMNTKPDKISTARIRINNDINKFILVLDGNVSDFLNLDNEKFELMNLKKAELKENRIFANEVKLESADGKVESIKISSGDEKDLLDGKLLFINNLVNRKDPSICILDGIREANYHNYKMNLDLMQTSNFLNKVSNISEFSNSSNLISKLPTMQEIRNRELRNRVLEQFS